MAAVTAVVVGLGAGPAFTDAARDGQWVLTDYKAESALWPVSQGDGVTVAVIDSGVMKDHQDLSGQVLSGADFSGESGDGTIDRDGHGTGMASLIAGHGHGDGAGIMGLAPKARILPVRVSWTAGSTAGQAEVAKAIRFAVDRGAGVVNLSIGGFPGADDETRAAVKYAVDKDVVLVASTGNSGDQAGRVEYPAAFPGVVAVGAVDRQGRLWEKSSYGPETTLTAPGADIYRASVKSSVGYGAANGTSDAAAYVSATAALVRAAYPGLSAGQVINRMITSASAPADASAVPNGRYGYGILAPAKALEANPAVDGGPRENPLVHRAESQYPDARSADDTPGPVVPRAAASAGWYRVVWGLVGGGVLLVGGLAGWVWWRVRRG
ncbi:type VII secretion-associated serine protease mycosin [Kitasatospora sp. NPDC059722]|uniref:type VII secretion-associated serine protease mycosin n=1 Tax=Kitasatospora sp. NPDC059722 TaxID=3346925 RepID=UPI003675E200